MVNPTHNGHRDALTSSVVVIITSLTATTAAVAVIGEQVADSLQLFEEIDDARYVAAFGHRKPEKVE